MGLLPARVITHDSPLTEFVAGLLFRATARLARAEGGAEVERPFRVAVGAGLLGRGRR